MSKKPEEQLAEALAELDDVRAEYKEYAYMISHELAAPFRQIEGFASIISSNHGDQFGEKTNRHFELIIKGAEKGASIVEALLAYSRLSSPDIQKTAVDCNDILDDVVIKMSSKIGSSDAKFTHVKMPVINGDSAQLNLLFYHLIHNSLHYHKPDSQPIVAIEASENDEFWDFCISDNGIGIPDNYADKVFIALKRAVSEKVYDGMGMGLALSKRIVKNHGGEIWLQKNVSDGCVIKFTLPK